MLPEQLGLARVSSPRADAPRAGIFATGGIVGRARASSPRCSYEARGAKRPQLRGVFDEARGAKRPQVRGVFAAELRMSEARSLRRGAAHAGGAELATHGLLRWKREVLCHLR